MRREEQCNTEEEQLGQDEKMSSWDVRREGDAEMEKEDDKST